MMYSQPQVDRPFYSMTYKEKLTDPRWQRLRLEIFQRDDWSCLICKRKDLELQIHHCDYFPNVDPWDYPRDMLYTLCKGHHSDEMIRERAEKGLITMLRHKGFMIGDLWAFQGLGWTDEEYMQTLITTLRNMQNGKR